VNTGGSVSGIARPLLIATLLSLSSFLMLGLMIYLLATSTVTRSVRRLGYAGCAATVLAVAFSRLYLDAHWASDVAGRVHAGPGVSAAGHRARRARRRPPRRRSTAGLRSAG
jgi:membrane-associated phospholipid phosphatase